jgi:hypothetical protein
MAQYREKTQSKRVAIAFRAIGLALLLNLIAWLGASWGPGIQKIWPWVSLLGCFFLGLIIGRWWALLVIIAFGVIHAMPVYLGLLPGYLSNWDEALWWIFAVGVLLALTALGVLARHVFRRLQNQSA